MLHVGIGECSTAVGALLALVSPLPYSADFRPYFTIHDPDFQTMASAGMTPNSSNLPRLLGVTNKYFLKVCTVLTNHLQIACDVYTAAEGPAQHAYSHCVCACCAL